MALFDTWLKEFEDATRIVDDVTGRLRERELIVSSGGDPSNLISSTRRKITVLGTCVDRLESLLQNPPEKSRLNEEEFYRRQDMLLDVRSKTQQMAASFSTSPSNRFSPTIVDTATKETEDLPIAGGSGSSKVIALPPNYAMATKQHSLVDVAQATGLHTYLLSNEEIEGPNPQAQGNNEGKDSRKGCNLQLLCLIILTIVVLLLLVWTIIRIW